MTNASMTQHASLVIINGTGVLIRGEAGSGKSELCLHLLERQHQLVSDDAVLLTQQNDALIGRPPQTLTQQLHLRALGLVNPAALFGRHAIATESTVDMAVQLCQQLPATQTTRLNFPGDTITLINTTLPLLHLPTQSTAPPAVRLETYVKHFTLMASSINQ